MVNLDAHLSQALFYGRCRSFHLLKYSIIIEKSISNHNFVSLKQDIFLFRLDLNNFQIFIYSFNYFLYLMTRFD